MTKNANKRETKPMSLPIANLRNAEWNTHRASKKDDAAYIGLVDNINANGMMHRVVVMAAADATAAEPYRIIDGHRRVEAARALGWKEVPCEVYPTIGIAEAQALTLSANVQRLENDPILEAACIQQMADAGKTYEQIAAVLGKDARYVARRARLCNLSDKWREWFGHVDADADTMEMVAAHEKELQDEVFDEMNIATEDGEVDADDIERCFRCHLRKIDGETPFDTAECANCPFNTATHGWLFAPEEDEDCHGRCERAECYVRKWNAVIDAKIEALRKKKVEVREARQKWDIPNSWGTTDRKTKSNTQPWVYTEDGLKRLVWAEPRQAVASAPALTEEEKAEAKREKAAKKMLRGAMEKVRVYINANMANVVETLCYPHPRIEEDAKELIELLVHNSVELWRREDVTAMLGSIIGQEDAGLTDEEYAAIAVVAGGPATAEPNNDETTND